MPGRNTYSCSALASPCLRAVTCSGNSTRIAGSDAAWPGSTIRSSGSALSSATSKRKPLPTEIASCFDCCASLDCARELSAAAHAAAKTKPVTPKRSPARLGRTGRLHLHAFLALLGRRMDSAETNRRGRLLPREEKGGQKNL